MLTFAFGPLGLRPRELAPLLFSHYLLMTKGHLMKEEMEWARTREVLAMLNNTSMVAKKRNLSGRDLVSLSIDSGVQEPDEQEAIDLFISLARKS